jgi:hypothetical protein
VQQQLATEMAVDAAVASAINPDSTVGERPTDYQNDIQTASIMYSSRHVHSSGSSYLPVYLFLLCKFYKFVGEMNVPG